MRKTLWIMIFVLSFVSFMPVVSADTPTLDIDYVDFLVSAPAGKDWTGAYGKAGSSQSVDGEGGASYRVNVDDDTFFVVSGTFQKGINTGDEDWQLRVTIRDSDDTNQETASTTAAYGVVSVSWSCFIGEEQTTPTDIPGIPGFPVAAIVLGMVIAFFVGIVFRRRQKTV